MKTILMVFTVLVTVWSCQTINENEMSNISEKNVTDILAGHSADGELFEKGVRQCAGMWRDSDGTPEDFGKFVEDSYVSDPAGKEKLFMKLSKAFEQMNGAYNQMTVDLQKPTVLQGDAPEDIDYIFGSYSPSAHFYDDMFSNKVAFITVLNFPHFTLSEKNDLGKNWSRLEWAYSRMGDMFTSRVPASVLQEDAAQVSATENYIADYNIMMGHLLTEDGRKIFPEDMVLLSHWNLRDELKSNYADVPDAHLKQEMIYKVMERIVRQDIPFEVVNNPGYDWNPFSNRTWKDGREVTLAPEGDGRYQQILNTYHSMLE
ncbi:MAG: hypothetical protein KBS57_03475, partial [Alistipes sp.]|nr:hypothetical protein [Candidatus Minthomonas equi]